ncbi:MAG: glycosyltransferase family 39 protein [Candidatus Binatia bacterium]
MDQPRARDRWLTCGVFAVAALVLATNLGHYALWDPDEGRHSEIARELFAASTWQGKLLLARNFEPYHDKPILYYWLTSAAYGLVGVNELGARLVSALAALTTLAIVFAWCAAVWNRRAACLAVAVLISSIGFLGLGRYGSLDMLLTCWLTLGLTAAERWTAAPERRRLLYLAATAGGLGMLTKGLVAPLFIGAIPLVHAIVARRRIPRTPRAYVGPALAFLAVAAPWYVAVGLLDPTYLRDFFLVHHLARFSEDRTTFHAGPWWYYGPALLLLFFPWGMLLPATLRAVVVQRDAPAVFCLCWAAVILGFFSCSHGKLATYALPVVPPLAALTARMLARPVEHVGRLVTAGLGVVLVMLTIAPPMTLLVNAHHPSGVLTQVAPSLWPLPVAALVLVGVWRLRGARAAAIGLVPAVIGGALFFYVRFAPQVSRVVSERGLAVIIDSAPPAPIVTYSVTAASLLFYVGRPVVRINRPRLLRDLLAEHPFVWIVTSPRHVAEIAAVAAVYPWDTSARHVLYAPVPPGSAPRLGDAANDPPS